jgi:hypothetical protein
MTNFERMTKGEMVRESSMRLVCAEVFRALNFGILSSFGIRHSSFFESLFQLEEVCVILYFPAS